MCLGAMTWMGTHMLDPYRQVGRDAPGQPLASAGNTPLQVQVVALDWKWLFIYPIWASPSVNELGRARRAADRLPNHLVLGDELLLCAGPGRADLCHAGMETRLHAVINKPGDYAGISANYSGAGFSGMHFRFQRPERTVISTNWVAQVKSDGSGA